VKKRTVGIAALVALFAEYFLLRYPLLHLHRMKEWPLDLVVAALVISGIAVWVKNRIVPVCAVIGYAVGFAAGYFFQISEPVKMTNNLWIIWTLTLLGFIVLGVILSVVKAKQKKKTPIRASVINATAPDSGEE